MKKLINCRNSPSRFLIAAAFVTSIPTPSELYAQNPNVTTPKECNSSEDLSGSCRSLKKTESRPPSQRGKQKKSDRKRKKPPPTQQAPGGKKTPGNRNEPTMMDDLPQKPDDKF